MNREIIDSVPIPIIVLQDHKFVLVNKEALRLFGAKREKELIGTLLLDRIHPDFKNFAESRIQSLIDDGNQVTFIEEDFLHFNGTIINAEVSASSVSYQDSPAILIVIKDITKQNQIEQRRVLNFSLLRATLESTADGIVVVDNSGRITDFNKRFTDIWSIPDIALAKPIDKKTFDHILDQIINPKNFLLKIDKLTLHPKEESFDVLEFKDGRFFERYSRPQLVDGKPIGRVWSYRDITKRKLAEEELIEEEKNFRLLFENSPLGIYIAKPDGTIIDGNKALLSILDSPSLEATKNINLLTFPPLVNNGYSDKFRECVKENKTIFIEILYNSKWGKESLLSSYIVPLANKNGIVEKVYTIILDITKQKAAESALRDSEEKLLSIIKTSPDAIGLFDTKAKILIMNPAAVNIFGYDSEDEMLGKNALELFLQEDHQSAVQMIQQILQHSLVRDLEFKLLRKNGSWFYSEFSCSALYDLEGKPTGIITIIRDVTERKLAEIEQIRTEKQLSKYSEELKISNATKDKFFSIIAHDLRSPFQGMLGISEVIVNDFETLSKAELKYYFNLIRTSLSKQFELLSDLLEWARLQTGNFLLNNELISLYQEVKNAIDPLVLLANQKTISLKNNIDEGIKIQLDKQLIKMIIHNLVSNSIKFTKENGSITISADKKENFIEISVSDTGIGIPEEAIEKLFTIDAHYSTDGTNHEHGTGLGLILCKDFAEKAGGQIWVESQVSKGSTFTFSLPIQ